MLEFNVSCCCLLLLLLIWLRIIACIHIIGLLHVRDEIVELVFFLILSGPVLFNISFLLFFFLSLLFPYEFFGSFCFDQFLFFFVFTSPRVSFDFPNRSIEKKVGGEKNE